MKVLIYTHAFAPRVGGVETFVMLLAQGLSQLSAPSGEKIDVTVATPTPAGAYDDRQLPFTVVRQPGIAELWRRIGAADVVQLAGPAFLPLALALLRSARVVLEHHGFQAACPNGQLFYEPTQTPCPGHFLAGRHLECLRCNAGVGCWQSLRSWLLTFPRRWLARRAKVHVTPTHWHSEMLQIKSAIVIPHGVPSSCEDAPVAPPNGTPATFAYVGRLVSAKGVGLLLQAVAALHTRGREFRLLIVGEGPERHRLECKTAELGLSGSVEFLGRLDEAEMRDVLDAAAAVVMPSLGGEVFGLVAAENMRCGRLVIVSDLGALREVVGDTGLVFRAGDVHSLARCMEFVLDEPEAVNRLRQAAKQRAEWLFPLEKMVAAHLELYRQVCPKR